MSSEVSKTDYLKRYLENDKSKRKKKSKPKKVLMPGIKIIEENIDLKSLPLGAVEVEDEEDAPVVAEVIDDRPQEVKMKELYEESRWKRLDENEENTTSAPSKGKGNIVRHDSDDEISTRMKPSVVKRHDSDSDVSPPRRKQNSYKRHDADSDASPPRKKQNSSRRNVSPPRLKQNSSKKLPSDSDVSPPRRKQNSSRKNDPESDVSPPRRKQNSSRRNDPGSDVSPPRRKQNSSRRNDPDSDVSPPRRKQNSSRRNDSDSDVSPPRRKLNSSKRRSKSGETASDSDLSPPRGRTMQRRNSPERDGKHRPSKTLSGLSAGLQNATTLREETQKLREREKRQITQLDADVSGRHADTVLRDRKTGRRRDLEGEDKVREEKEKRKSEHEQKYAEWGKGVEQSKSHQSKFVDDLHEMSKPLARYKDDEDLDERLKAVIHEDDPMAEYMKKKMKINNVAAVPEYSGPPPPPNRFAIRPGYRWDGVNRSNGFEAKYFEKVNRSKATAEEAYLYSVQDM